MSERTLAYVRDRLQRAAPLVQLGEEAQAVTALADQLERMKRSSAAAPDRPLRALDRHPKN